MNLLKERIVKCGVVEPGNVLEVAGFLNHQMDITLPSSGFVFSAFIYGSAVPFGCFLDGLNPDRRCEK